MTTERADLAGKVALITGGGSGIGAATAALLAARGAAVVLLDRDGPSAEDGAIRIVAEGGRAAATEGDITDLADVERAVDVASRLFGGLHVLFNNAGVAHVGSVTEADPDEWMRVIAVNLTGPYLCSRAALPLMIESGGGSVVNNCSVSAVSADSRRAAYCASKGGLLQLTRQMALDYAALGVRVNAICPGPVDTPLQRAALRDPAASARHEDWLRLYPPLGREARTEEVAAAVAFLASDEAAFITGEALFVDGGMLAGRHVDMRVQGQERPS